MKRKLKNVLLECGIRENQIDGEGYIREECLDSIMMVEIIFTIEKEFGIEIDAEDIVPEYFKSIDTIMQLIIKNGGQKNG